VCVLLLVILLINDNIIIQWPMKQWLTEILIIIINIIIININDNINIIMC